MYIELSLVKKHFEETEKLLRNIPVSIISQWLLEQGYFPESNILPPTFRVKGFQLQDSLYNRDMNKLTRRKLISIAYPKTLLTSRNFSIQDPRNYHDIVFLLDKEWDKILNILFNKNLKIFSYSLPIPISKKDNGKLSKLRSGRMIYEWIKMAESDIIQDASFFKIIAKTDISNFYSSIYTHSIAWAIEGRETAFKDKNFSRLGSKIDWLIQYANDARTNGIPIGSALSDLIAEIIISDVDLRVSQKLSNIEFIATRFKDDYIILCQSKDDAEIILRELSEELLKINLTLNENKTSISILPDGLYRKHDREYFPHSIKEKENITFKEFEHTLLIALDIHRNNPRTSILEKFLSELLDNKNNLKLKFSTHRKRRIEQIKKFISLLFLIKRESEKILSQILALTELVYILDKSIKKYLKPYIKSILENEIKVSSQKKSAFEVVWYIFFSRYIGLGIEEKDFNKLINEDIKKNLFIKSMLNSKNEIFKEAGKNLFMKPSECIGVRLVDRFDVFKK